MFSKAQRKSKGERETSDWEVLLGNRVFFLPGKHPLFFSQKIAVRKKKKKRQRQAAARKQSGTSARWWHAMWALLKTWETYVIHLGLKFFTIIVLLLHKIVPKQVILLASNPSSLEHLKAINEYILVKRIVGAFY